MDHLPSINKIYSMVIQEEINNVSLLSKPEPTTVVEMTNIVTNAYDSRKFPGKSSGGFQNSNKDRRMCTYCNISGHTIDVCYHKLGFPPNYGKKQIFVNTSNASNGDVQHVIHKGEKGASSNQTASITQEQYSQLISFVITNKLDASYRKSQS